MKYLFITGWQRSGTTLLARALDAHPEITVASDPMFDFWKMARNKLYKNYLNIPLDEDSPMDDGFLKDSLIKQSYYDGLHQLKFSKNEITQLKQKLAEFNRIWPEQHAPLIIPHLYKLKQGNIKFVFETLLEIIKEAYGNEKTLIVGAKEAYCEHFIKTLLDKFDLDIKCIIMIRDPRAVFASRNTGSYLERAGSKYSALFIARNWRKSVAYHIENGENKNYIGIKYEDFVKSPKENLEKLSSFLGMDFSERMIDFDSYKDGNGENWLSNSSYGTMGTISTDSINKWKEKLDKQIVKTIESLCGHEMKYLGYKLEFEDLNKLEVLTNYNDNPEDIKDWQIKYGYLLTPEEIDKELKRDNLLRSNDWETSKDLIDNYFISTKVYKKLRNKIS